MRKTFFLAFLAILALGGLTSKLPNLVWAQSVTEQIGSTQAKIKQLEGEIASAEKELNKTQQEKNTLANTIKILDLTKKKLETQTKVTETKVSNTNNSISGLERQISTHSDEIDKRIENIKVTLRNLEAALDITPVEIVLSDRTISDKVDRAYDLERLQNNIKIDLQRLKEERTKLSNDKQDLENARNNLLALKSRLQDEKKLTLDNISVKNKLLSDTKNKESNYKTLLEQKIAQKATFEQELRNYERSLGNSDLSNVPHPGSGILAWPLDSVTVTQYFGNTDFSKSGAYNGRGHNGIDFRASVGTAVKSVASGTVRATGNTDLGCPGGSYGKWILIDHGDGLSSIYAHLSLHKVEPGQIVSRSELIGYSGSTGYATGPHLHLSVYATEGVKVTKLIKADGKASKCTEMPVSPLNGYLNPLLYL
ncbi:MAG TPA: peptidoglycan DD-metalloendopeptidase family protein [Candidatus Paceibacterota bacterium]